VAPERFAGLLKEGDIGHVLHENVGTNMPFTLPSKLFDCLHAGLPILCGNQGEMAQIVREHDVGWCVDPADHAALVAALREAAALPAAQRDGMRQRARAAGHLYCWDIEQQAYLAWVRAARG
jgi:glycosyltransferase involved in cell wall biosynthesis